MRRPVVAGNWKMHTTVAEALALADAMLPALAEQQGVEVVLCPPFISLPVLAERLRGTGVRLGAQTMHWEDQGAFTGEISPRMLEGLVEYVIIGHSERRQYFCETDHTVGRKVRAALARGLVPIVCVGERLEEYDRGQAEAVVERQLAAALGEVAADATLVVAYEPVWAIGTGRAATPEGANEIIGRIRQAAAGRLGEGGAARLPILYGGSVTPANFASFVAQPEIDGALVGGASLKPEAFVEIVRQAARAKAGGRA